MGVLEYLLSTRKPTEPIVPEPLADLPTDLSALVTEADNTLREVEENAGCRIGIRCRWPGGVFRLVRERKQPGELTPADLAEVLNRMRQLEALAPEVVV